MLYAEGGIDELGVDESHDVGEVVARAPCDVAFAGGAYLVAVLVAWSGENGTGGGEASSCADGIAATVGTATAEQWVVGMTCEVQDVHAFELRVVAIGKAGGQYGIAITSHIGHLLRKG